MTADLNTVRSPDGTSIAYERFGAGPPLVLVHGSVSDRTYWAPLLPALVQHFTVLCPDRRGRGDSGDTAPYAIEREFEDIASVVDAIDEPVHLAGHSYGGICALEAALRTRNLRSLALYEPPLGLGGIPEEAVVQIDDLIADGQRDAAVELMMGQLVGTTDDVLARLRADRATWQSMVDSVHTLPRELREVDAFAFEAVRYRSIEVPTELLCGDASPPELHTGVHLLEAALPHARVITMPGVDHEAISLGPDTLSTTLITELAATQPL